MSFMEIFEKNINHIEHDHFARATINEKFGKVMNAKQKLVQIGNYRVA